MRERRFVGEPVTRLSLTALILMPAAVVFGDVPVLVKTTKTIKVGASGNSPKRPAFELPGTEPNQTPSAGLRTLIKPTGAEEVERETGPQAKVNRFVELQSGLRKKPVPEAEAGPKSMPIPQRGPLRQGAIRVNQLFVDAPPKLRRFDSNDPPAKFAVGDSDEDSIRIAQNGPRQRPIGDLDQALDLLKPTAEAETTEQPLVRDAARGRGFGMLALDQIGDHLKNDNFQLPETQTKTRPMDSLRTQLTLPPEAPKRREVYLTYPGQDSRESLPLLPKPEGRTEFTPLFSDGNSQAQDQLLAEELSTPSVSDAHVSKPFDVEDLIEFNVDEAEEEAKKKSSGWMDKLTGWTKKLGGKKKPAEETQPEIVQPRRARASTGSRIGNTKRRASRTDRSGGLLGRWFE